MAFDETKEWVCERKASLEVSKRGETKGARCRTEESLGEMWIRDEESKGLYVVEIKEGALQIRIEGS